MSEFIVEIQPNLWLADWSGGDPSRTISKVLARRYATEHGAKVAIGMARRFRPFKAAKIVPVESIKKGGE